MDLDPKGEAFTRRLCLGVFSVSMIGKALGVNE
jgi:hypothetical protein